MAATPELDDLISMNSNCYNRLRGLLAAVPDGQMEARVGEEGLPVFEQFFHSCGADIHYLNVIDSASRRLGRPAPDKAALEEMLAYAEGEVVSALEGMSGEDLRSKRQVKWREGEDSCLWILLHMIGHKYYHVGQLQSILHVLASERTAEGEGR